MVGRLERARLLDDQRDYYQTFAMDVAIPLFYNEPPSPINNENREERHDLNKENNNNEQNQGVNVQGDADYNMGDDSSQSTAEWPSMGENSSDEGSPISIMGLLNSSEDESPQEEDFEDNNHDIIEVSEHDSMPTEEAPWALLAASVIGEYKGNTMAIFGSGLVNAKRGQGDFWRRVIAMPRFKKPGYQKRRFKERKEQGERGDNGKGGKRKRGASSDPGQGNTFSEEQDTLDSTANACKRFCLEGKEWLARVKAGEGTSRQGGSSNVEFVVEYEGENSDAIKDMMDNGEIEGGVKSEKMKIVITRRNTWVI